MSLTEIIILSFGIGALVGAFLIYAVVLILDHEGDTRKKD